MDYHNKYKLAISIMTANRKAVLEEVLQKLLKPLYDRKIGLYLFDGSDKGDLAALIEDYRNQGFDNLHYSYYDPKDYKGDERYIALQRASDSRVSVDADYVWLCSDKFVPRPECLDSVIENIDKGYDIIVYNVLFRKGEVTKAYEDKVEFFRDCGAKLQMLLVPIIKKEIAGTYTKEHVKKCADEMKYLEIEMIFQSISNIEEFKGLLLCLGGDDYWGLLPISLPYIVSGHVKEKRTLEVFVEKVYNTITGLPSIYDSRKKEVMKKFSCNTWFSFVGFVKLRRLNGYDFKQSLEYLGKWKYVTNVPVLIILLISLYPPKAMDYLYKIIWSYKRFRNKPCF